MIEVTHFIEVRRLFNVGPRRQRRGLASLFAALMLTLLLVPGAAHAQKNGLVVSAIEVQGNARQSKETILTESAIRVGDTKINIVDQLSSLSNVLQTNDQLVIHLSGHSFNILESDFFNLV